MILKKLRTVACSVLRRRTVAATTAPGGLPAFLRKWKSAAEQRGLLKSAEVDSDGGGDSNKASKGNGNSNGIVIGKLRPPGRGSNQNPSGPKAAVDEHRQITAESDAEDSTDEWIDHSRQQRIDILVEWLTGSIGMAEVFLIDARGYSLLPEPAEGDGRAAESGFLNTAALQDLGLRLGGVLDLASRRLQHADEGHVGEEHRVARLSLPDDRILAVAKVAAPASQADGLVLGWLEAVRSPVPVSWVESACEYVGEVLALDHSS